MEVREWVNDLKGKKDWCKATEILQHRPFTPKQADEPDTAL